MGKGTNSGDRKNRAAGMSVVGDDVVRPEILVLFGSQTGNAEQAAEQLTEKLNNATVKATPMQLDDFLELRRCQWTPLVVIITSSYGVGQAPLGCYRFRALCDAILKDTTRTSSHPSASAKLNGLSLGGITYALLGLGDSKYTTYFQNPTVIDNAMTMAGATRLGPLGKADASAANPDQAQIIQNWITKMVPTLLKQAHALHEFQNSTLAHQPAEQLETLQRNTLSLCLEIFEDFPKDKKGMGGFVLSAPVWISMIIAILSVLWYVSNNDSTY
jgi:MioC protein